MAWIQEVRGLAPRIASSCWLAPTACVIGDVELGANCSVWFHAVLRGDVNAIRIGKTCNIQDGAILHCTYERSTVWMGDEVSVGHGAIIHGCRIENRALIGMNAVVMDDAVIESDVIVAAGAIVLEGMVLKKGGVYAGVPARMVKSIDEKNKALLERTAHNYIHYADWFRKAPMGKEA